MSGWLEGRGTRAAAALGRRPGFTLPRSPASKSATVVHPLIAGISDCLRPKTDADNGRHSPSEGRRCWKTVGEVPQF